MDLKLKDASIGDTTVIRGSIDGIPCHLFMMKDKDYVVKLMTTCGSLSVANKAIDSVRYITNESNNNQRQRITFKYTECFENYYKGRHAVDDHNHSRHIVPSIEGTWNARYWDDRVFQFILAISEVNAALAKKKFGQGQGNDNMNYTTCSFRRKLAVSLINNDYVTDDAEGVQRSRRMLRRKQQHLLRSAPPNTKYYCTSREIFIKTEKNPYQRYTCKSPYCKNRTRTYCICNPSLWMCNACFPIHVEAEVTDTSS